MAYQIFTLPSQQALDTAANVLSGATLTFSLTGVSTPTDAFSDAARTTPVANPLPADSAGVFIPIFLDPSISYRIVLKTQGGSVLKTWDPANENLLAYFLAALTANVLGLIFYPRTAAEIAAGVTPANYTYNPEIPIMDLRRFGLKADRSTDDAPVINAALIIAAQIGGAVLQFPDQGIVRIKSKIVVTQPNVIFRGMGRSSIIEPDTANFDLFQVLANDTTFEKLSFYGQASGTGTVQMGINSLQATPALRLRVRNCYFGGSSSSARLNDAIKYDTGCSYGEFFFNTIEEMQGAISGTGYGVLAGAVDALKCMGNSVYGATGRGRHAFYLSTGARYCQIVNNFSTGMNQEHITLNALVSQGDNAYNIVQGNVCVGGNPDPSTGAISVWGKNTANTIADNVIISPGQMGIVVSSLNAPGGDCPSVDNIVRDNLIYLAGTRGIEVIGTSRTWLSGNRIRESSQISAGVSSNIRLVASSGGQGVTDCLVTGNYSDGPTNARSAFQINASAPTPTGTYLAGNHFPVCNVTDIELGSVSVSGTTQQVGVIAKRITITYSASMTIDASIGNEFDITATNGTAFTINAPTNPVDGQAITVTIANNSGGALGAVTWNAVFKMSAWTQPANNNNRSITFKYNGTNWQQISQTGVDVPN